MSKYSKFTRIGVTVDKSNATEEGTSAKTRSIREASKDKILYAINDEKVTRENRRDVEDFCKLDKLHKQGKLSESKKKRRNRIMVRLMKAGILKQLNRKALEEAAQLMYNNFPWHRKLKLRFQFLFRKFKKWFSSKFLKNRKVK